MKYDPSPLYAVKVNKDGSLDHSGAYDPHYYQECENPECKQSIPKTASECPHCQASSSSSKESDGSMTESGSSATLKGAERKPSGLSGKPKDSGATEEQ